MLKCSHASRSLINIQFYVQGSCDKDTEIECDYFQSEILLDSGHQDMHSCKSNDVSYQIDFTEDVVSSNQLKSGEVKLCILKDAMGGILSLDDFKFIDVPHVMNGSANAIIGTRKVLVLRVKATDTETKHSASELSAKIFGGGKDRLNMGSQFIACSLGQLKFEAFAGSRKRRKGCERCRYNKYSNCHQRVSV